MLSTSSATDIGYFSGYQIDKLVRIFTGSYDRATDVTLRVGSGANAYLYVIPHGLTRPVFCELIFSTDGGIVWQDGGITKLAFSDAKNVYIFDALTAAGSGTVLYKVYCSWIGNYDATNPLVETISYNDTPLQLDSRLNFQKILDQDVLSFTPGTFGATETQIIKHPLSYVPNAKVYFEPIANEVWPLNAGGAGNPFSYDFAQDEAELSIFSDRIEITHNKFSNATRRSWYRIYYDAS